MISSYFRTKKELQVSHRYNLPIWFRCVLLGVYTCIPVVFWPKFPSFKRDLRRFFAVWEAMNPNLNRSQDLGSPTISFLTSWFTSFTIFNSIWMYMDVEPKIEVYTPKWMVKIMEHPIKMDDLGVPLFLETPIYIYIISKRFHHHFF